MPSPSPSPLASDIAAALDWWREAGVDAIYADAPRTWLADPRQGDSAGKLAAAEAAGATGARPSVPSRPSPPPPPMGGERALWPRDLAAFREWWLAEPSLDEGGLAPRVAPRGEAGAELMVLIDMPEEEDSETLLSGPGGRLLDSFLAAAGLAPGQVYRAAALPRRTPVPDWAALAGQGMGAVLAHHVALARPKRLLIFGTHILPLCGHDPAQGPQKLRCFNHDSGRVPALSEPRLERLLEKPGLRARMWRHWLDWTDGQTWDVVHG